MRIPPLAAAGCCVLAGTTAAQTIPSAGTAASAAQAAPTSEDPATAAIPLAENTAPLAAHYPVFGPVRLGQAPPPAAAPFQLAQVPSGAAPPSSGVRQTAPAPVVSEEEPEGPMSFRMRSGRPTLSLFQGNLTVQPVTRIDLDMGGFRGQNLGLDQEPPKYLDDTRPGVPADGLNVRRARVGLQGTYLKDFSYNFTWELATSVGSQWEPVKNSRLFELQTAYQGFGWITPRIGFYTLMHTIEFSMSSFELTFMERPSIIVAATSLSSGDSRLAIGAEARGDRWFASAYLSDGTSTQLDDSRQRGIVARANGMLVNEDWAKVVVGGNAVWQLHPGLDSGPQQIRLRDYPELRLDPTRLLDTGNIPAGSGWALGPELSAVVGPVYLQAEYQAIRVDADNGTGNRNFWGYYITAAVPLIGAPRRYDRARGVFTRPRYEDLNPNAGTWGWLELAARWSYINLNDFPTSGGTQGVASVALNYYPTGKLRVTLQYSNGQVRLNQGSSNSPFGVDRAFQAIAARLSFNW
jgi:phosphate-selective porin OprO and OprP